MNWLINAIEEVRINFRLVIIASMMHIKDSWFEDNVLSNPMVGHFNQLFFMFLVKRIKWSFPDHNSDFMLHTFRYT